MGRKTDEGALIMTHPDGWKDEESDVTEHDHITRGTFLALDAPATPDNGEPFFTLVGRDLLAADTVDHWIRLAEHAGVNDVKLNGARRIRDKMRKWTHKLPD